MHSLVRKGWPAVRTLVGLTGIVWCLAVGAATVGQEGDADGRPDGRCDRCDGGDHVRTICVKRMTAKEITKVCWDYRSEQVCIPGPSLFCGTRQHRDECGCWTCRLWKPMCAEIITRRVPVKREVRRTVPAVEWSVEERCCHCRHDPTPTPRPDAEAALPHADEAALPVRDMD